jgi:hypothetical protein
LLHHVPGSVGTPYPSSAYVHLTASFRCYLLMLRFAVLLLSIMPCLAGAHNNATLSVLTACHCTYDFRQSAARQDTALKSACYLQFKSCQSRGLANYGHNRQPRQQLRSTPPLGTNCGQLQPSRCSPGTSPAHHNAGDETPRLVGRSTHPTAGRPYYGWY